MKLHFLHTFAIKTVEIYKGKKDHQGDLKCHPNGPKHQIATQTEKREV